MGALNRRKFLKYAGAAGAAVGASALGLNYLSKPQPATPSQETTTATTATATTTSPSTAILPIITRLTYEPSKVLNSKIYDIRVDVQIADPAKRLSSVIVALEPVAYEQAPTDAFPQEERRTALLQSVGQEKQTLSAVFSDLKGGREYDLRAGAADFSGVVDEKTSRIEYIREFENIAPLDDTAVIADYYTWYGIRDGGWTDDEGRKVHVYTPLLGQYESADPIVISKHIDWATGYGIDAFAVSWWGSDYTQTEKFENGFLRHPMANQMKFFILYENNGRLKVKNPDDPAERWIEDLDDPFNRSRLLSDFEYLTKYFSDPQYLRVDGKPCVRFDYTTPFRGDIQGVFGEVRSKLRSMGWEIYLINDLEGRSNYPSDLVSGAPLRWRYPNISPAHVLQVIENTDAIGGSGPPPGDNYKAWRDFSVMRGKGFVPVAWPGMEPSPFVYTDSSGVKLNPELLRTTLDSSIEYSTSKMTEIMSFNEWIAGHQIEPAKEYGFTYLEVLRKILSTRKATHR